MQYILLHHTLILPAAPSQPTLTAIPLYDSSGRLLEIESRAAAEVSCCNWSLRQHAGTEIFTNRPRALRAPKITLPFPRLYICRSVRPHLSRAQ